LTWINSELKDLAPPGREGGLRGGYATYDGSYEVALFARNITDDLSRTGGIDFNNLTGFVNEPRTWGIEFRAAF